MRDHGLTRGVELSITWHLKIRRISFFLIIFVRRSGRRVERTVLKKYKSTIQDGIRVQAPITGGTFCWNIVCLWIYYWDLGSRRELRPSELTTIN